MGNRPVTKAISTRIVFINTTLNPIDKTQFSTSNNALYCVYLIATFINVSVYHESRGCSTKTEGRCILGNAGLMYSTINFLQESNTPYRQGESAE
jgi:hypothetical protein